MLTFKFKKEVLYYLPLVEQGFIFSFLRYSSMRYSSIVVPTTTPVLLPVVKPGQEVLSYLLFEAVVNEVGSYW